MAKGRKHKPMRRLRGCGIISLILVGLAVIVAMGVPRGSRVASVSTQRATIAPTNTSRQVPTENSTFGSTTALAQLHNQQTLVATATSGAVQLATEEYQTRMVAETVEALTNQALTASAPTATRTPTNTRSQPTIPPTSVKTAVPTNAPETETYYATSNANIRSCPRTNCETLGSLQRGQAVNVLDTAEGEAVNADNTSWYEIDYRGETGYVYSALLSREQPASAPTAPAVQQQLVSTLPPAAPPTSALPPTEALISTPVPPAPGFTCNCSLTCEEMSSCEEAYFQLQQCGCGRRDSDHDGVPCENICPGG